MTATSTLLYVFMTTVGSAIVNLLIAMYFFKWKKKPSETADEILRRDQHDRMWKEYAREHGINGG